MKNQPTSANSASDSTTRLIRPLEPKRVPSVVPGLEGVAACAFEDSQEIPELPVEIPQDENAESTDDASEPELGDLVDCVILPVESEEESIDPTAEVEIQPFDPAEFNDYLLREYENFLSENPDWITENSGGDMHAQIITPSQYTDLELADPGAARAFDLWFENTYLSYCELDPTNGDTTFVDDGQTQDSGNIFNTRVIGSGEILPYQRSGGELEMNQPVEGKFVVEQGGKMTGGDQAYGEGSYEISAEGQIAALPAAADTAAQEEAAVQAAAQSGIPAVEVSNSPVTPIVSGSNSVLESPAAERVSFNGESQLDQPDIALPTLIETRIDSSSGESDSTDDIAFIDDAPVSAIQNSEPASGVVAPAAAAQQNIAAAVGGAFVAGSATQVPTGRGTVAKKGTIG
jgi:hypothetical protein